MIQIMKAAKGNPGALAAAMSIHREQPGLLDVLIMMEITGTKLYVLWSDLCDKNPLEVAHVVEVVPGTVLMRAASQQDYSGRELIKPYL